VFYDRAGDTLTVWFGDPHAEFLCQEIGDEMILIKDRAGRVIGVERLNFSAEAPASLRVTFESVMA